MTYVIMAALSNLQHRESGTTEILFPLNRDQYAEALNALREIGAGDAQAQDCVVEELDSFYGVLDCLKGQAVNMDELDYLAKRLDSFDEYEALQYQAACHALGCKDIQSLINMTFCCQQTTVISDFSKLEQVGKRHYLTTRGGCAPTAEMDRVDGKAVAEELIQSEEGILTPYGLFFQNRMRMAEPYQGQGFPPYLWEQKLTEVEIIRPDGSSAFTFLPTSEQEFSRFCRRNDIQLSEMPSVRLSWLKGPSEPVRLNVVEEVKEFSEFCDELDAITEERQNAFFAAVEATGAEELSQMWTILNCLDDFTFCPGVKNAGDYGRYMVQESGQYRFDVSLEHYYDYEALGEALMEHEYGKIICGGYLKCDEGSDFADFFIHSAPEQKRDQTQDGLTMEMGGM